MSFLLSYLFTSKYSTNDYELVIKTSKELEYILDTQFNAKGKGLHEKINSIENDLNQNLISKMRYLATIRNKLIHQKGFDNIPDRKIFIENFEESEKELKTILASKSSSCIIS